MAAKAALASWEAAAKQRNRVREAAQLSETGKVTARKWQRLAGKVESTEEPP